jgi:hypothetical protein
MTIYSIALLPETRYQDDSEIIILHMDALSRCLQATKDVFEYVLSMPLYEYHNFSSVEWSRLVYIIVTIFRLCAITPTVPGWEFGPTQQKAQFGVYLESLSFRMSELTAVKENGSAQPDIFSMFMSVLKIVREAYADMVANLSQNDLPTGGRHGSTVAPLPRCPVFTNKIKETEYWNMLNASNAEATFERGSYHQEDFGILSQMGDWDTWDIGIADDGQFDGFQN